MASDNTTESSSGMPQLNFETFPNQIFWVVITLVLIYLMIKFLIIPRMDNILTNRRKVIEEDLVGAENFKEKANELKNSLNNEISSAKKSSQDALENAKEKAKKSLDLASNEATEITNKIVRDGEKILEKTKLDADAIVDKVSEEILPDILRKFSLSKK